VEHVTVEHGISERFACRVLGQHRSTQRKVPKTTDDEAALTADIIALAIQYGRYGYRRITALLRNAGQVVNVKRVERIWRREGLKVPTKQPKRGRLWLNDGSCVRLRPEYPNHVWSYDFVEDRTHNGKKYRMLTALLTKLFAGARNFASGFFMTVLFLFSLLVSGDIFLHRLVEILPRFRSKRQVVEISQQIESDVSAYLATITIMNAAMGIAVALAMWLTGVGDPILWGTVAFLLNYVPILGTALGVLIFLLAGLLTHDTLWQAFLPAGLYFGFHLIEGETVTPMLLARRFTLNPVLVIISLVFWFWMWGVPGAILSMPMLAITKIICDRLQPLAAFGHFLEG
jgi:hypothetical protein